MMRLASPLRTLVTASLAQRPLGFVVPGFGRLLNKSKPVHRLHSTRGGARSVSDFTTSELKRLLTERGVDFRDCLEKSELVARLQAALRGDYAEEGNTALAGLSAGERNTVKLFERVSPSVAFIQTSVVRSAGPLTMRGEVVPQGSGSGFVWDDQGHIVTNYHVIQQAQKATVTGIGLGDGSMNAYEATLVGAEPEKDIAVLKVRAPKSVLRPITVGSSSELLVGQSVFAIGNPFGLDSTLTQGIVSAVGREVQGVAGRPIKGCVQTDASINPGNSGGPLLDAKGRLVGVNTAIYSPSGASAGIGFAIPVDTVRRIVNQLIRYGRMLRPSMGITVADDQMTRGLAQRLGTPLEGVLVMEAPPNTPGGEAGLTGCMRKAGQLFLGDLITEVNGVAVRTVEDLLALVEETEIGSDVVLRVMRGADASKLETVRVKTVDRAQLR